jgi:hypothetical protein
MNQAFLEYYRCPERFGTFTRTPDSSTPTIRSDLHHALPDVASATPPVELPFDPTEIIETLRRERYLQNSRPGVWRTVLKSTARHMYQLMRPALTVTLRKHLQKFHLRDWTTLPFPTWPVDRTVDQIAERLFALALKAHAVDRIPFIWFWPDGMPSCAILTHDVETAQGRDFCSRLMDLDDALGFKSSFQVVPENRYHVPTSFLDSLRRRGFEINIHDLNHDGYLFRNRDVFLRRAERINHYGRTFGALGFRSGSLYRNPEWFPALDFAYDMSIPSVAHLEPQRGGCCTVLPFFIGNILELPVTATQDYSLFHILNTYSVDLWKRQIGLITEQHGLINFIIHPDYLIDSRPRQTYQALLEHLANLRASGKLWIPLPRDVDKWWRQRSQMKLVRDGNQWRIEGEGRERARLAYGSLVDHKLVFTIEGSTPQHRDPGAMPAVVATSV